MSLYSYRNCLLLSLCLSLFTGLISAQNDQKYFGDRCEGYWTGTLYLSNAGQLTDSLDVVLEIQALANSNTWKWKTSYEAKPERIVKDYTLVLIDAGQGKYMIDEGDGIKLDCYQYDQKLYSTFSVNESLLTAIYEIKGDSLLFEVTSGKRTEATGDGTIFNYSVQHVQKVLFQRK